MVFTSAKLAATMSFYYGTLWLLEYSVVRFPHNDVVARCLT